MKKTAIFKKIMFSSVLMLGLIPSISYADTIAPTPNAIHPVYVNSNELEIGIPFDGNWVNYNFNVTLNGQPINSFSEGGPVMNGEMYYTINMQPPFGPTLKEGDQITIVATADGETTSEPLSLTVNPLSDVQTPQPTSLNVSYDGTMLEIDGITKDPLTKITITKQNSLDMIVNSYDDGQGSNPFNSMMEDPRIQAGDQLTIIASAPGEQDSEPITITVPQAQPYQPQM